MSILGIVGHSGSGKTTLIESILPLLAVRGMRVNVIKHSHHDFELEPAGKDSYRFRAAGAAEVMVCSPYRYALFHELRHEDEPTLASQIARLAPADLTLIEGFHRHPVPRIEVFRSSLGRPARYTELPDVLAVASDAPLPECQLPVWPLNDPARIVELMLAWLKASPPQIQGLG